MSSFDPVTFFESVTTFQESADPTTDNRLILATVDSYVSGFLKLIIDGEAAPTVKTFSWVGQAPRVGTRVVVMPIANTFLVLGELNNNTVAELNAYVAMMPRGILSRARSIVPSAYVRNQAYTNGVAALSVTTDLFSNRIYKIIAPAVNIAVDNAPCRISCGLRATVQTGANAGQVLVFQTPQTLANNTARHDTLPLIASYSPVQDCTVKFDVVLSTITAISSVFPQSRWYADATMPAELWVEDMGIYI